MNNDFNVNGLYAALDEQRITQGLSWAGVAREIENRFIKVSASTIKGVRDKQLVEGDGGLQMLLWLGRSPESFMPGFEASKKHNLVLPANTVLRFDVQQTYKRLEKKRFSEDLSWQEVATQIGGYSVSALRRFEKGGRTFFPDIMRVARWLDVPANKLTRAIPRVVC